LVKNIQNNENQEKNDKKLNKESSKVPNNEIQINNINQINTPEIQMTQEQINKQIMLQYQNQIN